jgi:Bacteriophage replication protein O
MTSKKRKYGDLSERPLPTEDESLVDDVFAAFTRRPSKLTTSQPALNQPVPSQPNEPPLDGPLSQPVLSQPTASPLNLLDSLPDSAGYTKTPNRYYDHLCSQLTPDEQAVYSQLFRLSYGHGKDTCFISNNRLSERSSVPLSTCKRVVSKLVGKGLVEKVGATHGPGKEQGVTYRLPSMSQLTVGQSRLSQPAAGHNKVNTHKEHTQTQEGVRVGSKFSIEECRRYAQHLRSTGQGINNPGGYATTIHRTGEADSLIEVFLNPSPAQALADTNQCPDCQGTGFYYPKGIEQGVAKCQHARLSVSQESEESAT